MIEVLLYALLDLHLDVEVTAENPYDPAQADVALEVTGPDGAVWRWPAFFDGEAWRARLRPTQVGDHAVRVLVGGASQGQVSFHVEPSDLPGPIHPDGWGFRREDGRPFVPIGLNLGWSDGGGVADYQRWFAGMSVHGGNFARVWVTHFTGQDPEWSRLGWMDPAAAAELDAILDAAEAEGVAVMLVLWQHSELESASWSSWEDNPYNADNGGPCATSSCFFTDETALMYQLRFTRYAIARWGAHPALAAWEVMNEVDGIVGVDDAIVAAWAGDIAETIRSAEGGLHPVSWSYSLPPQARGGQEWVGADFPQVHSYLLSDVGPVTESVAAILDAAGTPVLVGEWGLDWLGNGDRADREGLAWHNANWAALASGSAGGALTWWWNDHVAPDDLWWRLEGPAAVAAAVDLPALGPVAAAVDDEDLEVFARGDGETTLAWVHLVGHSPPDPEDRPVEGASLSLGYAPRRVTLFETQTGAPLGELRPDCDGKVPLPVIRGDIALIAEGRADPCGGVGCAQAPAAARTALGWGVASLLGLCAAGGRRWVGKKRLQGAAKKPLASST